MNSLVVESPGLLTTVQDLGRVGYGAMGVSPSGAADPVALRLANLLVGNVPGAAALEMTLLVLAALFAALCVFGIDRALRFVQGRADGRDQDGRQNADDRDHGQQFDEGKGSSTSTTLTK